MIKDLDARLIQGFLDVLILKALKKEGSATGYSLIGYFHRRFHVKLSSGTVYAKLYQLERQGFLEGNPKGKKRLYRLTRQGEDFLSTIRDNEQRNHAAFLSIFSVADS